MRCKVCSKLGSFFKRCAGMCSKTRVPVLSCFLVGVALLTVLLSSVFCTSSVSAAASDYVWLSFYQFRNYTSTQKWYLNRDSSNDQYLVASGNELYVEEAQPYWNDTTVIYSQLVMSPQDQLVSIKLSHESPLTAASGGFYIDPRYEGYSTTFSVALDISLNPCLIDSKRVSLATCRLFLSNGRWISCQWIRQRSYSADDRHFYYSADYQLTVTDQMVRTYIVGFEVNTEINMNFSPEPNLDPSDYGNSVGLTWKYILENIHFPELGYVDDTSLAVQNGTTAALGGLGDALYNGTTGTFETAQSFEEAFNNAFFRVWSYFDPNTIYGSDPSDLFPSDLTNGLSSVRFLFNYLVGNRTWINTILRWSLAFGGLGFLLSIAHSVSKIIRR